MRSRKSVIAVSLAAIALFLGFIIRNGISIVSGLEVDHNEKLIIENYHNLRKITVDADLSDVEIIPSDKDYLEVTYPIFKDKDMQIKVEHKGDTLEIKSKYKKHLFSVSIPSFEDVKTIIAVPQSHYFDELDIKMAMGSLKLDQINSEKASLKLDMGSLKANQSNLGEVQADLAMGSMEVNGTAIADGSQLNLDMGSLKGSLKIHSGKVDVDIDMGSVELEMIDGPYYYDVKADMGQVNIADYVEQEGRSADEFKGSMKINVDMGKVEIY